MTKRGYVKSLHEVKKVIETKDINEVNEKVKEGWMLLKIITPNHSKPEEIVFSLGKFSI